MRCGRCGASPCRSPWDHFGLHRQQALALQFLACELAGAANGFRLLSDLPLKFAIIAAMSAAATRMPGSRSICPAPVGSISIRQTGSSATATSSVWRWCAIHARRYRCMALGAVSPRKMTGRFLDIRARQATAKTGSRRSLCGANS
jgi:hypothetical protein